MSTRQTNPFVILLVYLFAGIAAAAQPEKVPTKLAITRVQQTPATNPPSENRQ
jgi:hypothetical protein